MPVNDQAGAVGCVIVRTSCVSISASTAPRTKNAPILRSAPTPRTSEGTHRVCVKAPAPPTVGPTHVLMTLNVTGFWTSIVEPQRNAARWSAAKPSLIRDAPAPSLPKIKVSPKTAPRRPDMIPYSLFRLCIPPCTTYGRSCKTSTIAPPWVGWEAAWSS
jgi:hypothetical protein